MSELWSTSTKDVNSDAILNELHTANLITAYQDDSLMSRLNHTEQAALQDRIINRLNLKENK